MYGQQIVKSESEFIFGGEFFDLNNVRYYRDYYIAKFKFIQYNKYYIEIGGKTCWCNDLPNKIYRFATLNGNKIPNPATGDEVKSGRILLFLIMAVSSIFKCNVVLWIIEIIYYLQLFLLL
jgi:hypothetical protein